MTDVATDAMQTATPSELQEMARQAYRDALDLGEDLSAEDLAERFGMTDRWARSRRAEVRTERELAERRAAEQAARAERGSGMPGTGERNGAVPRALMRNAATTISQLPEREVVPPVEGRPDALPGLDRADSPTGVAGTGQNWPPAAQKPASEPRTGISGPSVRPAESAATEPQPQHRSADPGDQTADGRPESAPERPPATVSSAVPVAVPHSLPATIPETTPQPTTTLTRSGLSAEQTAERPAKHAEQPAERTDDHGQDEGQHGIGWLRGGSLTLLILGVGAIAAVVSFGGQREFAEATGWAGYAWMMAVLLDAPATIGALVALPAGAPAPARRYARRLMFGAIAASAVVNLLGHLVAANLYNPGAWVTSVSALLPPLILAALVHLAVLLTTRSPNSTAGGTR